MKVKRIVATPRPKDIAAAKRFYHDVLGLESLMDEGGSLPTGSAENTCRFILVVYVARRFGHAGPDLSIEVDDLEEAFLQPDNKRRISRLSMVPRMSLGASGVSSPATPSASGQHP